MSNVFGKSDLMLPDLGAADAEWERWSVIACDQHTSDISNWEEVEAFVGDAPSTYGLVLPEAYLGLDKEKEHRETMARAARLLGEGFLKRRAKCLVFVERTLESGLIRRGIVGEIALDAYDYAKGSKPEIRPTEGTVAERIPPRVAVRREATYEASHVMLFTECDEVFAYLDSVKDTLTVLYDFDLMACGGHITGRLVSGEALERAEAIIASYEDKCRAEGRMMYGVGDGNHSLASAKALLEEKKASGAPLAGAEAALVELVSINDSAIVFEPIYKLVTGVDVAKFSEYVKNGLGTGTVGIAAYAENSEDFISASIPEGKITCGALQELIDSYIAENGGSCDYIHGKDELISFARSRSDAVGFIFDGISKDSLFPYVSSFGTLPRKAFSMGEASEKRYYTELRKIK